MSRKKAGDAAPEVAIPVTPMLDMAFQLLTFFIFTYHPSGMEGQMEMALPSDDAKAAHQQKDQDPTAESNKNPTLELPADLLVILQTQSDGSNTGELSSITVEERSGKTPVSNLDALLKHLEKVRESVENKSGIKLQADSRLKWDGVVQVMDVCRRAGFNNISFAPPPDFGLSATQ